MTIILHGKAVKYFSAISLNERIIYLKLLFRWQGSLWKLLWADFLWFFLLYIGVTLLYRVYLIHNIDNKKRFEAVVSYMNKAGALVPLSFLLGFFVSTVLGRWWEVIKSIPWMTKPAFSCQALISGGDKGTRRSIRNNLMRYMNLAWILSLMNLSQKVKDRFYIPNPETRKSLCNKKEKPMEISVRERLEKINSDENVRKYFGRIISEEEIRVFENFEKNASGSYKAPYIVPLMWANKLLEKALAEGYIVSERYYLRLYEIILDFRGGLGTLGMFNEFNVPLVYTQVVIIVVYTFLLSEIFSQQMITSDSIAPMNYLENKTGTGFSIKSLTWQECFPIFTIFKFLIYMGWFKIGLSLINPLGDESTDIPLDIIMDYNLEISTTVGPAEDIYYPEYLSDDKSKTNKEKLQYLRKFHHTPSSTVKLLDNNEEETKFIKDLELLTSSRGDSKPTDEMEMT